MTCSVATECTSVSESFVASLAGIGESLNVGLQVVNKILLRLHTRLPTEPTRKYSVWSSDNVLSQFVVNLLLVGEILGDGKVRGCRLSWSITSLGMVTTLRKIYLWC